MKEWLEKVSILIYGASTAFRKSIVVNLLQI